MDDTRVLESGSALLRCASGTRVRQRWSSVITPTGPHEGGAVPLREFPARGQLINLTVSPFTVNDNRMNYEWEGTVAQRA